MKTDNLSFRFISQNILQIHFLVVAIRSKYIQLLLKADFTCIPTYLGISNQQSPSKYLYIISVAKYFTMTN